MDKSVPSIFLFAGEKSGDLHGGRLLYQLKKEVSGRTFWGVGGPEMRQEGLESVLKMEDFEVMGISDVLFSLPSLFKKFYHLKREIIKRNPEAVILIDYPGFNLRLAKALRNDGYKGKLIHYICPSVWAHSPQRVQHMAKTLDLLLVIFPFESKYFINTSLPIAYVGNPLQEYLRTYDYKADWKQHCKIPPDAKLVALFPGSRRGEIDRHMPEFLKAAALLKKMHPELIFALSSAHPQINHHNVSQVDDLVVVPTQYTYELMRDSYCAIAKSGTVTLELALHQCPTVAVYKMTLLNKWYAKYILGLNLPFYILPNIIADKVVFPELIKEGFSSEAIVNNIQPFLNETPERQNCLLGCKNINTLLKKGLTSQIAASKIRDTLSC